MYYCFNAENHTNIFTQNILIVEVFPENFKNVVNNKYVLDNIECQ